MDDKKRFRYNAAWAVGGGTMLGLGIGLLLLPHSVWAFVGILMVGIGVGLLIAALLTRDAD